MNEPENLNKTYVEKKPNKRRVVTICLVTIAFVLGIITSKVVSNLSSGTQSTNSKFSILESVYNLMENDWYFGKDKDDLSSSLIESAIKGMVDAQGDTHTQYMTADEMNSFSSSLDNTLVGVGVSYQVINEKVLIRSILPDSPAEAVGLQMGDLIIAIDGKSTSGMTTNEIKSAVTGKVGTVVKLSIQRGNEKIDYDITRAQIYTSVTSKILDNNIGYVNILSFSSGTSEELQTHLDNLRNKGVTKIVLDLRDNGGGYLDTLMKMSAFFMDQGSTVLVQEYRNGSKEIEKTSGAKQYNFENIVMLVNENSASCTEVFAAAMRINEGTKIVGTTTYGKGTVQVAVTFADGSALKYTDAQWLTPNNESIDGKGVTPDYEVKLDPALYESLLDLSEEENYSYDSVSTKVATAQKYLKFLGYSVDRTDGYFSKDTQSALTNFQTDHQLTVNGQLNMETGNEMNSALLRVWDDNRNTYDTQLQKALELINE